MDTGASPSTADPATRYFAWLVLAIWLATSVIIIGVRWEAIAGLQFMDVDDQLRMVQVRDWIAGQSFYDVTQYRMNPPFGAAMHWSRLVDLPLAAIILLVRPLWGTAAAEVCAMVTVPLVTLGATMGIVACITRQLANSRVALLAPAFVPLCVLVALQMLPLRVDHHGWQIALSLLAMLAALDPRAGRSGVVAGAALATGLQISLEVLPIAVWSGALFALRWAHDPNDAARQRVMAYVVTLVAVETGLSLTLHGTAFWARGYCDAVSPPQMAALAFGAAGVMGVVALRPKSLWIRLTGLICVAGVAAGIFRVLPPHCGLDAFNGLEPLVRTLWYNRVSEGLPVWQAPPALAAATIAFPIIGLMCAAYAWRRADWDLRSLWASYVFLLVGFVLAAAMVQRIGATANAAAVPAAAWMAVQWVGWAQRSAVLLVRVAGSTAALLALLPVMPLFATTLLAGKDREAVEDRLDGPGARCSSVKSISTLQSLGRARLLAPLDMGPVILYASGAVPLASGHHRNHVAMNEVITAFVSDDRSAHDIINRRQIAFVIYCADRTEMQLYRQAAPNGLAAHLMRGNPPAWLVPAHLPGSPIQIWRVIHP